MASFNALVVSIVLVYCVKSSLGTSTIEMPKECEDKRYCEIKPKNFPQESIDKFIKDMANAKDFLRPARYDGEPKERIIRDDDNCHTKVSIIRPFIIRTNTTMKFVVQTNVFEQRIKQTECVNEGAKCFKAVAGLSFRTSCTPTFGTIKMYLYDPLKKVVEYEAVSFPVCCSCSFKTII